jgi:hypothetical protein
MKGGADVAFCRMNSCESFSADYRAARARFRDEAARAGGALEHLEHPQRGPDGAELHCDVAWFGPRSAERVLVTISGTHGVEGFCGSGAQVDWLRRGEAGRLPSGLAVLMIHAVNPHGFAWLRRVTHENVDLNRNWIDFSQALPGNAGYDELADALCPARWADASRVSNAAALGAFVAREGAPALKHAILSGQYRHPRGIFYGGEAPTWSRRTQTSIFAHYLAEAGKVAIIDYHSGLGPWGFGEQIVTQARQSAAFARAASWFGAALTSTLDGSSASTAILGDGLSAAPGLLAQAQVTAVALEVGTQPQDQVLQALCADAWLHAHGDCGSALGASIKQQIRAAFYGDADDWKGMVAGQSLLLCKQAIAGLLH